MTSQNLTLGMSLDESFKQVQQTLATENFKITTVTPNSSITSEGGRNFGWPIMVVCILLFWPAAIVYYFMSSKNSIAATFTGSDGGTGSVVSITANGKKAEVILQHLTTILKENIGITVESKPVVISSTDDSDDEDDRNSNTQSEKMDETEVAEYLELIEKLQKEGLGNSNILIEVKRILVKDRGLDENNLQYLTELDIQLDNVGKSETDREERQKELDDLKKMKGEEKLEESKRQVEKAERELEEKKKKKEESRNNREIDKQIAINEEKIRKMEEESKKLDEED